MRRLFVGLCLVVLLSARLFCQVTVLPDPLVTSGQFTMYDFEDHDLKIGLRYPVLGWEFLCLDGDLITDMDTVALGIGLGLDLFQFARYVGLKVYLADNINIGFNGAYNFRDKVPVYGPFIGIRF